jgi:hypothetical protein
MIDGKAKQFDDGLYAALDQAYYQGLKGTLHSHVELVRRIYEKVDSSSPATAYLAAGLELAGVTVPTADPKRKDLLLADFRAASTPGTRRSNPVSASSVSSRKSSRATN